MDDHDLAADLVRDAGTLAATMLADGLETHYKTSVSDVVSAADHAAEERVLSRLIEHRPDDGVVGEEGASRPGRRTWYIDPVDGTYNFLNQIPYWCSAIGLAQDEVPVVGAVYYPAMDELWVGGPDRPTTRNAVPVTPLADEPLDRISVCTYLHPNRFDDPDMFEPWRAVIAGHRDDPDARLGLDRPVRGRHRSVRPVPAEEPQPLGLAAGCRAGPGGWWCCRDRAASRTELESCRVSSGRV